LDRPHFLVRVSVFHQQNDNLLAPGGGYIPTASGPYVVISNIGRSTANGLELGCKGIFASHYRWSMNYRPEIIRDHFIPTAQNAAAYLDYQHTTPIHLLKGSLGWANDRWEMDGYFQFLSADEGLQANLMNSGANLVPVPAFIALDGRVAFNLNRRITWAVSGQNLTHASQIQTGGPAVERRALGTMSFTF